MNLRDTLIRGVVLCCMLVGMAYVDAGGAALVEDCSDYDFSVCMEGEECLADGQDCEDLIAVTGADCVVANYDCKWTLGCFGKNPTLICEYDDQLH